jgi:hypothetical protein
VSFLDYTPQQTLVNVSAPLVLHPCLDMKETGRYAVRWSGSCIQDHQPGSGRFHYWLPEGQVTSLRPSLHRRRDRRAWDWYGETKKAPTRRPTKCAPSACHSYLWCTALRHAKYMSRQELCRGKWADAY